MPYRKLNVPEQGVLDAYQATLSAQGYVADKAQMRAAERLQRLYSELLVFKLARRNRLKRFFARPLPPKGVYFWGGVGRGKSFLMDCFFESVPYQRKKRIHFHAFMQRIHKELEGFKGELDPMLKVAAKIAKEARLLCFDEFHVSDIADAMILGRLLTGLEQQGVVLVMTSNYPPDGLYPNGLQRENFLPAIELLKRKMDVVQVEAGIDYRLRSLGKFDAYLSPVNEETEHLLRAFFLEAATLAVATPGTISVLEREIPVLGAGNGAVWFDFSALCGGPRSQNDYLEIAKNYSLVFVSGLPRMSQRQSSEARRFTWLVDVLYEYRVKLVVTAECAPEALYPEGALANEFVRTVSRLIEMQSEEYWEMPHIKNVV